MASPAPALIILKKHLLGVYPAMGSANIGIMGDTSHQARVSDHNEGNAIDIPVAGGPGAGAPHLALCLALLADPRAHYLIYNRTFYHKGRAPAPYTGTSPHTAHAHLSIDPAKRGDVSRWTLTQPSGGEEVTIITTPPAGLVRFWRLIGGNGDYFYTSSVEELRLAIERHGYTYEQAAFDVSTTDPTCTVPLRRFSRGGFHMLTTSATEVSALLATGWTDDGIVANVSSVSGVAVRRYAKGDAHIFTANATEQSQLIGMGWSDDGVAFLCGENKPVVSSDNQERIAELEAKLDKVAAFARDLLAAVA